MDYQLEHHEISRTQSNKEIVLIADNLTHPQNYGGLIRTAEAFGVKKIIFVSDVFQKLTPKMKKLSRSAEKYIDIQFEEDIYQAIQAYQNKEYELIALEFTQNSIPIQDFLTNKKQIVLICGNENFGVNEGVLKLMHTNIKIPVYGTTSSLNVVVATGIALNHISAL